MVLGTVLERFVQQSPVSVMARAAVEYALAADHLDALFAQHAQHQYTRDLLFSTVVDLMALVVTGVRPSLHAAYQADPARVAVSLTAVYAKLQRLEPGLAAALVQHPADRLAPVLDHLGAARAPWVAGYTTRILDGNHRAATEHRLGETRADAAAPLPGQALGIFAPAHGLVTGVLPWEDAHAQERALLDQVIARLRAQDLWVADRNFGTRGFLLAIVGSGARFVIRVHANLAWEAAGKVYGRGRGDAARVREQRIALRNDAGERVSLRRVTLERDRPTQDGDTLLAVLTNLTAAEADARRVGQRYRQRWTIEGAFQELAAALQAGVATLGYPRAALFAFAVGLAASNVLGVVKGALRAAHGADQADQVSGYYLADEWSGTSRGMMIAIPAAEWRACGTVAAAESADLLKGLAARVRLAAFRKHPRGPKQPAPQRRSAKNRPQVSTARILEKRRRKHS